MHCRSITWCLYGTYAADLYHFLYMFLWFNYISIWKMYIQWYCWYNVGFLISCYRSMLFWMVCTFYPLLASMVCLHGQSAVLTKWQCGNNCFHSRFYWLVVQSPLDNLFSTMNVGSQLTWALKRGELGNWQINYAASIFVRFYYPLDVKNLICLHVCSWQTFGDE